MRFSIKNLSLAGTLSGVLLISLLIIGIIIDTYASDYPVISLVESNKLQTFWWMIGVIGLIFSIILLGILEEPKKSHAIMGVLITIPLLLIVSGSQTLLNGVLDKSAPQLATAQLLSKKASSGKTGTHYSAIVKSDLYDGKPTIFRISNQFFSSIEPNDQLKLTVRNGALGDMWVQSYEKATLKEIN